MTNSTKRCQYALAVAPNGARKTHLDHPQLPITPSELARCAQECLDIGAAMIHLHVRKADFTHSLEVSHYEAAVAAIRKAVGDRLVIQLTTEAVGVYKPSQQIATIKTLRPEAASVAIRELVQVDESGRNTAGEFFQWMRSEGVVAQYILYDADDVNRYAELRKDGHIPKDGHWVLFVLGRYSVGQTSSPSDLLPFLAAWKATGMDKTATQWAVCAFGNLEADCAAASVLLGGHARIGFENNMLLPTGQVAPNNAALLQAVRKTVDALAYSPMDAYTLRSLTFQ
ncbi:3-keto-5-aminohexanoate cleavage protein [Cupriavidus pauculus]|uniref:3-keto-5-aminohexanoate cleavage protein n=1 Tax=Cupriavidus pauculus TaxID=82633 RepID=A0A3G8HCF2_9BURK|nr:3-keto-5-aminohexanoate cleavage protein [Cupriavidus pauculus]AZG17262.1 3-keto-5-aminohexanoate cleavage protein [Cupriavidus pauculus]